MGQAEVVSERLAYGQFLRNRRSAESKVDILDRIGDRNLTRWGKSATLFARLIADIEARKPFSLIRLGDGEGNVLFWGSRRSEYPALARYAMDGIWSMMFGREADVSEFDRLYEYMVRAVHGSDYLGMSEMDGDELCIGRMCDPSVDGADIRGDLGTAAVWDWISGQALDRIQDGGQVLVNAWIHSALVPDQLRALLNAAGGLSLITCHPGLLDRFVRTFGIQPGRSYLIPSQYSNTGEIPGLIHFPERFEEIEAELIARDLHGEFFLVGAGVVGKAYCDRIKRQGGMAIDAGSMMDVWMGIGVRQYHSREFLEKFRLGVADPPWER